MAGVSKRRVEPGGQGEKAERAERHWDKGIQGRIASLEATIGEKSRALQASQGVEEELRREMGLLKTERAGMDKKLARYEGTTTPTTRDDYWAARVVKIKEQCAQQVSAERKKLADYKQQYACDAAALQRFDSVTRKLNIAESQVSTLTSKLNSSEDALKDSTAHLAKATSELTTLRAQSKATTSRNETLRRELAAAFETNVALVEQNEQLQERLAENARRDDLALPHFHDHPPDHSAQTDLSQSRSRHFTRTVASPAPFDEGPSSPSPPATSSEQLAQSKVSNRDCCGPPSVALEEVVQQNESEDEQVETGDFIRKGPDTESSSNSLEEIQNKLDAATATIQRLLDREVLLLDSLHLSSADADALLSPTPANELCRILTSPTYHDQPLAQIVCNLARSERSGNSWSSLCEALCQNKESMEQRNVLMEEAMKQVEEGRLVRASVEAALLQAQQADAAKSAQILRLENAAKDAEREREKTVNKLQKEKEQLEADAQRLVRIAEEKLAKVEKAFVASGEEAVKTKTALQTQQAIGKHLSAEVERLKTALEASNRSARNAEGEVRSVEGAAEKTVEDLKTKLATAEKRIVDLEAQSCDYETTLDIEKAEKERFKVEVASLSALVESLKEASTTPREEQEAETLEMSTKQEAEVKVEQTARKSVEEEKKRVELSAPPTTASPAPIFSPNPPSKSPSPFSPEVQLIVGGMTRNLNALSAQLQAEQYSMATQMRKAQEEHVNLLLQLVGTGRPPS